MRACEAGITSRLFLLGDLVGTLRHRRATQKLRVQVAQDRAQVASLQAWVGAIQDYNDRHHVYCTESACLVDPYRQAVPLEGQEAVTQFACPSTKGSHKGSRKAEDR